MNSLKVKLKWIIGILIIGGLVVLTVKSWDALEPKMAVMELEKNTYIPTFTEQNFDFVHEFSKGDTLPFMAGVAFDAEGDGNIEVFIAGALGQDNAVISYRDGVLVDVVEKLGLSSIEDVTYAVEVIDIDNDGDDDLITGRNTGLYLQKNTDGKFTESLLLVQPEDKAFALSVTAGDYDGDLYDDLYISTFINPTLFKSATFNDIDHKTKNLLLKNNRNGTFSDVTDVAGVGLNQNTFLSEFADLNNDGKLDLVVAANTDEARVYENIDGKTFAEHKLTDNGFWMGLAVGDMDNDGDQDLFLTNSGDTIPQVALRGDLKDEQILDTDWRLFRNDGNFDFTEVSEEKNTNGNIFAWHSIFADFNNDGREDLIVTENYIKWPLHAKFPNPGALLIQDVDGTFVDTTKRSGVENYNYGFEVIAVDLNNDENLDIVIINEKGPVRVFINNG